MTQNEMVKEVFDSCCLSDFDFVTPETVKEWVTMLLEEYNMDEVDAGNYDYEEMTRLLKTLAEQDREIFYQKGVNTNE